MLRLAGGKHESIIAEASRTFWQRIQKLFVQRVAVLGEVSDVSPANPSSFEQDFQRASSAADGPQAAKVGHRGAQLAATSQVRR